MADDGMRPPLSTPPTEEVVRDLEERLEKACDLALYYCELGYGHIGRALSREKRKIDALRSRRG